MTCLKPKQLKLMYIIWINLKLSVSSKHTSECVVDSCKLFLLESWSANHMFTPGLNFARMYVLKVYDAMFALLCPTDYV